MGTFSQPCARACGAFSIATNKPYYSHVTTDCTCSVCPYMTLALCKSLCELYRAPKVSLDQATGCAVCDCV